MPILADRRLGEKIVGSICPTLSCNPVQVMFRSCSGQGTQNPKSRAKLWMMGPIFDWIIDGQLQLVGGIVMIGSLYLPSFLLLPGHVHDWPIFITI